MTKKDRFFSLLLEGKKKKILLRNAFAGSLKFEALQLQLGGLGGRVGGTVSSSGRGVEHDS